MTSALFSLSGLLIPIGIGLAGLFAAILAHRGHATSGTWTLLISSVLYLLSIVGLGVVFYFLITSISRIGSPAAPETNSNLELTEILMMVTTTILGLSTLCYSIGILLLSLRWKAYSEETEELEKLALELAAERT